jgi:hypothetical protein
MYETKGLVTSVSPFSETDDQITIEMVVPEPLGEEGETRSHDLIVPKGSANVGDTVNIVIKSEPTVG